MIHADTQRLTRARLELSSRDERRRQTATFVTAIVMLLLAGGGALYLHDGSAMSLVGPSAIVMQENAALRADLERVRTELEMEKATRAELSREAGELHARISELTNRLEFLAARDSRPQERAGNSSDNRQSPPR